MTRVVALVRARLRQGVRPYLGAALLLGIIGGLALFALAGARRVQSEFPRIIAAGNASNLQVGNKGRYTPAIDREIASLPGVVRSRTYAGLEAHVLDNGRPRLGSNLEGSASVDGLYFDQDRFLVTHGRMPNPHRVDEVTVNEIAAADEHFRVGDRVDLGVYSFDQYTSPTFAADPPPPAAKETVTIVGIGLFPNEVVQDDTDRTPRMLFTPAMASRHRALLTYSLQGLVLERGDADVDRVSRELAGVVPPGSVDLRVPAVDTSHTQSALRPLSIALALFGAIAAVAALVLVAQALTRTLRAERVERELFRALGATPGEIGAAALIPPACAVVGGIGLAVVLAVGASPLMPIGALHRVALRSGVDLDPVVLGLGGATLAVALMGICAVQVRLDQRRARRPREVTSTDPSRLVAVLGGLGLRPPAMIGFRNAIPTGPSPGASTSRSVMAGAVVAIAALVAAISFGGSLHALVERPHLYGWAWDAAVLAGDGYDNLDVARTTSVLAAYHGVEAWSGVYFGREGIAGRPTPLLGMAPGSQVTPPIEQGHPLGGPGQIVLGAATAERIDAHVGDQVAYGPSGRSLRVVGIAVFPSLGQLHVEHVSLGVGAWVAPEDVPGHDRDIFGQQRAGLGPRALFVRFRPGQDRQKAIAELARVVQPLSGFSGIDVVGVQRPAEIVNSSSLGSAPIALAGALALGAVTSLGLALGSVVRHRRRDLAILKALGFTPADAGRTVTWQATITILVGLAIGVPLGIAIGRVLWSTFTSQLDVVDHPEAPLLVIAGVAAAAIVIANVVAWWPARRARVSETRTLQRAE